jgi:hypothetical protein
VRVRPAIAAAAVNVVAASTAASARSSRLLGEAFPAGRGAADASLVLGMPGLALMGFPPFPTVRPYVGPAGAASVPTLIRTAGAPQVLDLRLDRDD